jgi:threonine synthase
MTTVASANVHNIAIEGTFDDCQNLLKAMFNDGPFREAVNLSAVNSINWARIMAQIAYYVYAAVQLGAPDRGIAFAVPTGNFGNVYAGYAAWRMGLPIERLIVGSNSNDIVSRFFQSRDLSLAAVRPTLSPSMDIQVSSNFERYLFELYGRDGPGLAQAMTQFHADGRLDVDETRWRTATGLFSAHRVDDAETLKGIADFHATTGQIIDPHSVIGLLAARAQGHDLGVPVVALATAHPGKFPDAIEQAIGIRPDPPARIAALYDREEHLTTLPNDLEAVQSFVRDHVR